MLKCWICCSEFVTQAELDRKFKMLARPLANPTYSYSTFLISFNQKVLALASLLLSQFLSPAPSEASPQPALDTSLFSKNVAEDSVMLPNALKVLNGLPGAKGVDPVRVAQ